MKSYEIINELKCWQGYHRVKGRPAGSPGSCAKNTNEQAADLTNTGFQQGSSMINTAPEQIQKDIQASNQLGGALGSIQSLRQGGPNTIANIAPNAQAKVAGMQQAQTDVNKRLAIAGVGQTPTAPQPVQQTNLSQYNDDELEEQEQPTQQEEPKQQDDRSSMRGLLNIIQTLGRAATSLKGRDIGADVKQDVQTMIRNKVTGEPNR